MPPILKTKTGSEILGDNKLAYDVSSFFEGLRKSYLEEDFKTKFQTELIPLSV